MDWMKLKSGSDVRGTAVGENAVLTPHVASCLGMAYARYIAEKKHKNIGQVTIALGRDSRISGPALLRATAEGISKAGEIVDIAIDQGGNCAITPPGTREIKHGVVLEGIKNIPGMLASSSTWMFAQNIYNLTKFLTHDGKIELDMNDQIVKSILVTMDGKIVHEGALEAMGLK